MYFTTQAHKISYLLSVWVKITKRPYKIKNVANESKPIQTFFNRTEISSTTKNCSFSTLDEVLARLMHDKVTIFCAFHQHTKRTKTRSCGFKTTLSQMNVARRWSRDRLVQYLHRRHHLRLFQQFRQKITSTRTLLNFLWYIRPCTPLSSSQLNHIYYFSTLVSSSLAKSASFW